MVIDEKQPEIVIMVGLPGSGKSTYRETLLAMRDYVIVSSDDEIEALSQAVGLNYTEGFQRFIGQATAATKQKFREAVNTGKSIIWDQTNLSPKKRRGILKQVPKNYRKVAVVFEVDDVELQRRLDTRERETGKHIPPEVIKSMAKSYVPPSKQEGFDQVVFV